MVKRIVKILINGQERVVDFGTTATPPYALQNIVAPSVVGSLYAGQEVTAAEGVWSSVPDSYSYRWLRNGAVISGATQVTYIVSSDDVGSNTLAVEVTASKANYYSASVVSAPVTINGTSSYRDLDDLTASSDTPVISFASLGGTAAPSFGGSITSSGWQREKRLSVAETSVGGSQTSTNGLDLNQSTRFRYTGIVQGNNWAGGSVTGRYAEVGLKTGGGVQNANWLFPLEFDIEDTDRVQIALNAPTANPRFGMVLVNGRRVRTTPFIASGISGGAGYSATLVFPTVGRRRIKIYGLNHNVGRFGGVAVPTGGKVTKPTNPIKRHIVFLGDSFTNGSTGVSGLETFIWDLGRAMGADQITQLGIGGTGFTNNGGDANGTYQNRVADILALNPDVLVISGGRNDSTNPNISTAVTNLLNSTESISERWVISNSVITSANTIIKNATQAAGVAFCDMSDHMSLVEMYTDNIHPTWQGHREFAALAADRMHLTDIPESDTLTPATGTPSAGLPWERPTAAQVANGPTPEREMLVHYYAPQPGAFNNAATDYYETGYLTVNGESGAHASYGGYLRDRPKLGAPFPTTPVSWQRNMQAREIEDMIEAGATGAFCNIMGSSGDNWNRYMWLLDEAAANFSGFKVVPMVDANGGMAQNDTTAVAAARINTFLSSSARWRLSDGRYVVATFKMEGRPLSYWVEVKNLLQSTYGKNTAWIGVYNNINQAVNYSSVQWAAGRWGPGSDPNVFNNLSNDGTAIKNRNEKYLIPTWAQDIRYRSGLFDESLNTEAVRAAGDALIRQNADLSQLCTWSDMSEASHFRSSVARGQVYADVNTYRLTKWRAGKFPTILRDGVYLSHRNQMVNATITGGQTMMLAHWQRGNMSEVREKVEVLSYLTAPANVTLKVGSSIYTYTAPAGEYAYLANMQPGEVSVKFVRSGSEIARVNSPVVIRSTAVNHDRQYFAFSSIRGTSGQYDPTPGAPSPNAANYVN